MAKKKTNVPKPILNLNIIVDDCWKCKKPMKISYLDDGMSIPVGPEVFSNDLIELAKDEGCIIEYRHSSTMDEGYNANVCPHCDSIFGMFFYHDFSYVPGDIQIFFNDDGSILERRENKD